MIEYPKTKSIQNAIYTGTWTEKKIPVYTVTSANGLNQLVGYVKHINAPNGTVLYRGQCDLHPSVIPSVRRDSKKVEVKKNQLDRILTAMVKDAGVQTFWNFKAPDIAGWDLYQKIAIESTLQHYGAETFCVDFVDNHWTALWFGLYRWNKKLHSYSKRDSVKPADEDKLIELDIGIAPVSVLPVRPVPSVATEISGKAMENIIQQSSSSGKPIGEFITRTLQKIDACKEKAWEQECAKVNAKNAAIQEKWDEYTNDDKIGHMYLFLYVAETNFPTLQGVSFGMNTYVVDLRKALPSTFLRPCSQHGWIVKGKTTEYCYEDNIACVIRINIDLVSKLLGDGALVSEENFFPSEKYDKGYYVLLQRQEGSHIPTTPEHPKILPPGMIK